MVTKFQTIQDQDKQMNKTHNSKLKYRQTISFLKKRAETNKKDIKALYYLTLLNIKLNDHTGAVSFGETCIDIITTEKEKEPKKDLSLYNPVYHHVANAYIFLEEYENALRTAQKGVDILPDDPALLYDLACIGYLTRAFDLTLKNANYFLNHFSNRSNDFPLYEKSAVSVNTISPSLDIYQSEHASQIVQYWLMTALIKTDRINEFLKLWHKTANKFSSQTILYGELLTNLEQANAWTALEEVTMFLFMQLETISIEKQGDDSKLNEIMTSIKTLYEHTIYFSKKNKDNETLENAITKLLNQVSDFYEISDGIRIFIAEFLLQKNMGEHFLSITATLLDTFLKNELNEVKTASSLAYAYSLMAKKQKNTEKGKLYAFSCLNMAWILTDDHKYLEQRDELEINNFFDPPENKNPAFDIVSKNPTPASRQKETPQTVSTEEIQTLDACGNHESFQAAFKEVDITPRVSADSPIALQGMAGEPRKAAEVSSPLKMQILLIEDKNHTRLLIVTADLFGFGDEMVELVQQAAGEWGIPPEGIILNASHTHYAPGTVSHASGTLGSFYKAYAMEVAGIIGNHLNVLYENLEDCDILPGNAKISIGVNRRLEQDGKTIFQANEQGEYDSQSPYLLIKMKKSSRKILMLNHGCHPTGLGNEQNISADFPGYFREAMVMKGDIDHVMYLQGTAGDIKEAARMDGQKIFCNSSRVSMENGRIMAKAVQASLNGIQKPLKDISISCACDTMLLPLKQIPDPDTIKQLKNNTSTPLVIREWADRFLATYPSGRFPNALALKIQTVAIGNSSFFITFPAEPLTGMGKKLKSLTSNPQNTFILGYTNGLTCYLPDDETIMKGGYEPDISSYYYMIPYLLERGTENEVRQKAGTCLKKINNIENTDCYGKYHLALTNERKAFFTLSAGRCGTKTLAHVLNTASNARVWHHPRPYLINETLKAYHNRLDKKKTFWKARSQILFKTWSEGLIHGETDHNITPFCDQVSEDIPDTAFIVLVRNPWDFVRSGMRRNYYQGHPWDSGRLLPEEDHPDFERWKGMSRFEKICWLWNSTYEYILEFTNKVPSHKILTIKFEDLISKPGIFEQISDFLGISPLSSEKTTSILRQKLNIQQGGNFEKPEDWSKENIDILWKICGSTAKAFGYNNNVHESKSSAEPAKSMDAKQTDDEQKIDSGREPETLPRNILFLELPGTSTGGHLDHIVRHFKNIHHVKYEKTNDSNQIMNAVKWADIVWLEWANDMAVHVTNNISEIKTKKVFCRLHGYEVFTNYPAQINWDAVHKLIFVAEHKKQIFNKKFNIDSPPCQVVLRNGVDMDKFSISPNKTNTKKLVLLGHLNFRKGLPLLIHFYHELLKKDPDYFLYIRGEFQEPRLEMAINTMIKELCLENKIKFVDWVDNLNEWLADKSHILSFSLEESFHYAVGNGMAAGMKPVIHAWNESRHIWPQEYIFNDLEGFMKLMSSETPFEPAKYRNYIIEKKLDSQSQIENIEALFKDKPLKHKKKRTN